MKREANMRWYVTWDSGNRSCKREFNNERSAEHFAYQLRERSKQITDLHFIRVFNSKSY